MLPGERQLCVLPAYHIAGLQNLFQAAAQGACVYLMRDYSASELLRVIVDESVVRAPIVPTMLADLLALPQSADERPGALRFVTYGGAPIDPGLLRRSLERFGSGFQQSYGMTEIPCLTFLTPADHERGLAERPELLRTVGRVGPGVELRIVDRAGRDAAPGEVGEIWGRGPQLMSGYWNQPEASAAALAGGWMHTGDAGSLDRDGYLTLADRIKDLIVSGGENIVPRELEELLLSHPSVADVAVIGTPDARWGEAVTAVAVLRKGKGLALAELDDFCRGKIGSYKRPRRLELVSEIPRNASGKVLKRELRERYARAAAEEA
jgi:fatty-acyl-CoA synthase